MSALAVSSAVNETAHISNREFKTSLQEDAEIIGSSLHFIDEFSEVCLTRTVLQPTSSVKLAPTDLLKDVLEPCAVSTSVTVVSTLPWTVQKI
jgi:hypothetical protein